VAVHRSGDEPACGIAFAVIHQDVRAAYRDRSVKPYLAGTQIKGVKPTLSGDQQSGVIGAGRDAADLAAEVISRFKFRR
jgi:hypothetical protein